MSRTASKALDNKTPYEALTGKVPSVNNLKPFGCLVYKPVAKAYRLGKKLAPRGAPCLFVSYDGDGDRGYRFLNLVTGKFEVQRTGYFVENTTVDAEYVTKTLAKGYQGSRDTLLKRLPFVSLPIADHDGTCVALVRPDSDVEDDQANNGTKDENASMDAEPEDATKRGGNDGEPPPNPGKR
jgi:hypothetical protein